MDKEISRKTFLVIGAGPAQVAGIAYAKKMGCKVIATDGDSHAPGLKIADIGIVLDVKDCDGAVAIADDHHVNGAFTIASEISLPAVAAVNQVLGLSSELTLEQVALATNKGMMRKRFAKHGVPSTLFFILKEGSELEEACRYTGFPAVIKPVDNAGSRGVYYVENIRQANSAYNFAKSYSRLGEVIIEKFMPGHEVSVEAFVANGEIHILTLSDKDRTDPPYLLDTAVMFPSKEPPKIQDGIKDVARQAIQALGIDNCPIHMELMLTDEGPKVVELAARGPGFMVYTDILPYVTGVNGVEVQISLLLGKKPNLQPRVPLRGACVLFFSGRKGKVKKINNLEAAKTLPDIYDMDIYVKPGDQVRDLTSGADRIGHVISLAETRARACRAAKDAYQKVTIEIEEAKVE